MFIKELSIELKLSKFNPNDAFKNLVENIYKALEKLKAAIEGLSAKHSQFNFEVLIETIGLCLLEIPAYSYEGEEESCGQEQVEMAMSQLLLTADKALHVFQQLQHGGKLEAWTASKITLCADYIETVADYMHYNGNDEEVSDDSVSIVPMEIESEDMIRR